MIIETTAGLDGRDTARRDAGPLRSLVTLVAPRPCLRACGCDDDDVPPGITKKAVSFDEVPEALSEAARKTIPGVEFKEAWQNLDGQGKLHSYEIRGGTPPTARSARSASPRRGDPRVGVTSRRERSPTRRCNASGRRGHRLR